jgi:hypothetical protein
MASALILGARRSLHPTLPNGTSNDAAGFASRCGPPSCFPWKGS